MLWKYRTLNWRYTYRLSVTANWRGFDTVFRSADFSFDGRGTRQRSSTMVQMPSKRQHVGSSSSGLERTVVLSFCSIPTYEIILPFSNRNRCWRATSTAFDYVLTPHTVHEYVNTEQSKTDSRVGEYCTFRVFVRFTNCTLNMPLQHDGDKRK